MSGLWSGLLSAAALVALTARRGEGPYVGLNAPSHWVYGDKALREHRFSVRHTLLGAVTHQASAFFWAALFAGWRHRRGATPGGSAKAATDALLMTGVAALVDLKLVPKRLTPGFEHHLDRPQLGAVYLAFAIGLAVAALGDREDEWG